MSAGPGSAARPHGVSGLGRRTAASGFTLLELLVVIAMAGILIAFAVLSGGGERDAALEREAQRLAQLTGLVRQQVILGGEPMALAFARNGYEFQHEQEVEPGVREWLTVGHDRMFRRRLLEDQGIELTLERDGVPVALARHPDGAEPHVVFAQTGLVTPFTLYVRDATDPDLAVTLTVGPGGRTEITRDASF